MTASHPVYFDVELSDKERNALKRLLGECEVEKLAKLTVQVHVQLAEKLPQPEAPCPKPQNATSSLK